jgi:carbamoyl-phosphate synthase large subunit
VPERSPTVLISSAGRRVELLRAFRRTLDALGTGGRVLAVDCSWYSGAFHDADEAFLVPRCADPEFVPRLLQICEEHHVDLVIPTLDPELAVYAAAREQFAAIGTTVAISSPEVAAIGGDKQRTHDWLVSGGFPTVQQGSLDDVRADPGSWPFPLIVKPRFGSASIGVGFVRDMAELEQAASAPDSLVQTLAPGVEHTIDLLASREGTCRVAIPRRRIEVRSGEVSKAVTVRSPALIELAEKLCAALPGAYGALNVQVFVGDEPGRLAVIEMNARFGGGYPLSYAAGADFPQALVQEALGLPSTAPLLGWQDGLVKLRYDAAVFVIDQNQPGVGPQ